MNAMAGTSGITAIPKRKRRHYSYDESVDEAAKLIEDEPVAIESERPAEELRPIENIDESEENDSPAYEE